MSVSVSPSVSVSVYVSGNIRLPHTDTVLPVDCFRPSTLARSVNDDDVAGTGTEQRQRQGKGTEGVASIVPIQILNSINCCGSM